MSLILTVNPDFVDLAVSELRQVQPAAELRQALAPGVWLVALPYGRPPAGSRSSGFQGLAEAWQQAPPIFVRHICPAPLSLPLQGTAVDIEMILGAVTEALLDAFDPGLPFSVQTRVFGDSPYRPFDLNQPLSRQLQARTGARLDVRAPQQILSLVIRDDTLWLGLSPAAHNLSDWAGGARRFAREPGQISRAEFKLLEALEWFGLALPPFGRALDLGAAPGGWSRVLLQRQQYVTAVDPAPLHASLRQAPRLRALQLTAEAYLASEPDSYDLLVNDVRQDARDSARLMAAFAPYLYPHGAGLMTLKLPREDRRAILDAALGELRSAYRVAGARQLFHNRSEVTVYLRPPAV